MNVPGLSLKAKHQLRQMRKRIASQQSNTALMCQYEPQSHALSRREPRIRLPQELLLVEMSETAKD